MERRPRVRRRAGDPGFRTAAVTRLKLALWGGNAVLCLNRFESGAAGWRRLRLSSLELVAATRFFV